MSKTLKVVGSFLAAFFLIALTVVLVNQTAQVVQLAGTIDPRLGPFVLWTLVALYALLLLVPIFLWLRMPAALKPPASEDSAGFERHLAQLRRRLQRNPRTRVLPLETRVEIDFALRHLDAEANAVVTATAATVFLSTAVSQSGRLDALMVLVTQARMVWRIAHVYAQRPSAREMLWLYGNVAGTALLVSELDDVEVEPLVAPVIGATLGSIPGLQQVTAVIVRSALSGAANAFLTLRVGMVAKRYCGALVLPEKRKLRRFATAEAAQLIGGIVRNGVATISKGVWNASRQRVRRAFTAGPPDASATNPV